MKKTVTAFLLLILTGTFGQSSSISDKDNNWNNFTYDLGNIFKGVGYSYTRPLHWQGKDWATFGGVMAGTALVYLIDDPTSEYFIGIKEDVPQFIREYGKEYASPQYNYMFTGVVYLTGLFTKDEKLRRTGVLMISSATSTGLLQQILKSAVGRARPATGLTKDTFNPFWGGGKGFHSFPSGHTILAFTNAYALAKQFKNPWVKGGIYTVGLIPGISRLWEGKHWLSDVVFSVALSIFTVEAIDRYLDNKYEKKYNQNSKDVSWDLNFGPGQLGLTVRF